jgi:ubiquinone biosynthesis protein
MSSFIAALIRQRNEAKKSENTTGRLKEILTILNKYDYEDGITPQIVVNVLQDLGPTFVKIGQLASQQSEQIPPEYCDALATLRSSVAPMDRQTVESQIQKYLGKGTDELFATFDSEPLGSASIGQVHRATLADGTVVAVKVRRPGVVDIVARDFALIEKTLEFNMKFAKGKTGGLDLMAMVEELEHTSKRELDFTNEARNLEQFWENNSGRKGVTSPKCYRAFTNEAILTEDFVMGNEAGDESFLESLGDEERDRLATLVADNFATQVLIDGFYHADPHSGNVLIHPDATVVSTSDATDVEQSEAEKLAQNGITWIDFGMMGSLSSKERQTLIDLVTAVMKHDAYGLKRIVLQVATPRGEIDHGAMLEMCESMCDQSTGVDFGEFSLSDLLRMVLENLQEGDYEIDPFLTNLSRGIIAAEGTVRTISPRVNILNCFVGKVNFGPDFKNLNLEETVSEVLMKVLNGAEGNVELPKKAIEALDMLEKGQIVVHGGMSLEEGSLKRIDRIVEKSIMAAMSIALFIGSCIVCLMSDPGVTRVAGIPAIGFVGYIVAIIFMFIVVRKMRKGE